MVVRLSIHAAYWRLAKVPSSMVVHNSNSILATCTPSLERGRLLNVSVPTGERGPYAERPVLVYLPEVSVGSRTRTPALLTLHSYGSNPLDNLRRTGLVQRPFRPGGAAAGIAAEFGWIVAAPYGSAPGDPTGCQSAQVSPKFTPASPQP